MENLKAGRDLKQLVHRTRLASLKDVVRKGVKLGEEEILERQIKWTWDEKRILSNPSINIWTEFSDSRPIPELPEYPDVTKPAKVTRPKKTYRAPGRPRALTPSEVIEIRRLRREGWSIRKLAKHFGVGNATIKRCLSD